MDQDGTNQAEVADEDPLVGMAVGAVTLVTLSVGFGLMFLGVPYFWVAFPVGFGGGMPLVVSLAKWYESNRAEEGETGTGSDLTGDEETDAALATLRERYARGDLDEAAFERRVERLLETQSVRDAETFLAGELDDDSEQSSAGEREREPERS